MKFLVVLDTMWGGAGDAAPRWFAINPLNVSGKRLYKVTGATFGEVLVTNACRQRVRSASLHGVPEPLWLYQSLVRVPKAWANAPLLVCGQVANATYSKVCKLYGTGSTHRGPVIRLKHPAARSWTKAEIARITRRLARLNPVR